MEKHFCWLQFFGFGHNDDDFCAHRGDGMRELNRAHRGAEGLFSYVLFLTSVQ